LVVVIYSMNNLDIHTSNNYCNTEFIDLYC